MPPSPTFPPTGPPIRGVIFDLNGTLIHGGPPGEWVAAALDLLAAEGTASPADTDLDRLSYIGAHIWDLAREIDPHSDRDLSPARHRAVFDALVARQPGFPAPVADAMYRTMLGTWRRYAETLDVLAALRERGIRLALLSNVGNSPRPTLARLGLAGLFDVEVLSQEVGVVKPDPRIFQRALDGLGLPAAEVLMVGDTWDDDGAAAALGIRSLLLPRTPGPDHGLGLVLRLIG